MLACGRGVPPPTNPLDESHVTATAAPDPATEAAREKAAARAIDAVAGWLGVAKTEFTIDRIDVVAWPDACLGVARPGITCAQVVTPGERITLRHRSGETYEVHLGSRDAAAWQPRYDATRTIAGVDLATGTVTLQPLRGSDEMGTRHRSVPGSVVGGIKDLKAGDRVEIAVAPWPERNAGVGAIVWLLRAQ